jgi:hypothetical protein
MVTGSSYAAEKIRDEDVAMHAAMSLAPALPHPQPLPVMETQDFVAHLRLISKAIRVC